MMSKIKYAFLLAAAMVFIMSFGNHVIVKAEDTAQEAVQENEKKTVKPVLADYDTLWLVVDPNGNNAVYYTDKEKNGWTEALKAGDGYYYIDLSWVKNSAKTDFLLKGDVCEDIVTITLPARPAACKAKFDKLTGTLALTGVPDGTEQFEWRKATSYEWYTVKLDDASKENSDFCSEMEKLRVAGGSIYVRLKQTPGRLDADGVFQPGMRQSKEIKVSIPKRSNAPKITVDGARLTVNTKKTMEYSLDDGVTWKAATDKMALKMLAPGLFGENAKDVEVCFRVAQTAKTPYSKTCRITIPAQSIGPVVGTTPGLEVVYESDTAKFYLTFAQAAKTNAYEYTIVKPGNKLNEQKASWKAVISSKKVYVSARTAPEGSIIYIRKKAVKDTATTKFALASAMRSIMVKYAAE